MIKSIKNTWNKKAIEEKIQTISSKGLINTALILEFLNKIDTTFTSFLGERKFGNRLGKECGMN